MDNKHLPIPRKFKPGQKATLEDLIWGRKIAAELVVLYPETLPIFQRLDRAVMERQQQLSDIERAKQIAKNGLHSG